MADKLKPVPLTSIEVFASLIFIPSDQLLQSSRSDFHAGMWQLLHYNSFLTALAWISSQKCWDDPLAAFLERGCISETMYDHAWTKALMYQDFWGICQLGARFVAMECKQRGEHYPFLSAYELFTRAVEELGDYVFSLCLLQYQEFSSRKMEKAFRLLIQSFERELSEAEKKEVRGLSPKTDINPFWHPFTLHVAEKYSKESFPLKLALERYKTTRGKIFKKDLKRLRHTRSVAVTTNGLLLGGKGGYKKNP